METKEFMDFSDALKALKAFKIIRRREWWSEGLVVFRQVPAHITSEIIPKMQSLPADAKQLIMKGQKHPLIKGGKQVIDYTSQCLIYNTFTGQADSWAPSISDVFAEDWEVVEVTPNAE